MTKKDKEYRRLIKKFDESQTFIEELTKSGDYDGELKTVKVTRVEGMTLKRLKGNFNTFKEIASVIIREV